MPKVRAWSIFTLSQACWKGGGKGGSCPPDFGRSEGAAGQRRRATLLPAPQIFRLCNMPATMSQNHFWDQSLAQIGHFYRVIGYRKRALKLEIKFLHFKNNREVAVRKIIKRQQLEIKEFYRLSMYLPHLHNSAKKFPSSVWRILSAIEVPTTPRRKTRREKIRQTDEGYYRLSHSKSQF